MLAILLHRAGIPFTVFERSAGPRPLGMNRIGPSLYYLTRELGDLRSTCCLLDTYGVLVVYWTL